jgi:hypothetical protein
VRKTRLAVVVPAAALILAACGGNETAGNGTAAGGGSSSSSSSPSAAATTDAGNGVADLSATEILAKAKAALAGADGVRIKGAGSADSTKVEIDMQYGKTGATGTFAFNGQRLDLMRVGQTAYMKGSASFWTTFADANVAKLLGDKWVKTSLTDARFKDIAEFTDLTKAADNFLDPDGTVTKGQTTTIDGTPAIGLSSSGSDGGTLYVATTGQPYPLELKASDNNVTFSDYGKAVTVTAPPAAQTIDATQIPGS